MISLSGDQNSSQSSRTATAAEPRPGRADTVGRGAGVSAGIDMALTLVTEIYGPEIAQAVQLGIEYDPQPPHDAGAPEKAAPEIVDVVTAVFTAAETA